MKSIRSERGQVAIFVALIFQVLFVFFAMLVNVGLLVHHKINLQNSADMAAYYGAMKQAEILNAMAHVNYQIRQSWKLFAWRYRVLGSLGNKWYGDTGSPDEVNGNGIHPLVWDKEADNPPQINAGRQAEGASLTTAVTNDVYTNKWYLRPLFCVANPSFGDWPGTENLCKITRDTLDGGNFNVPRINNVPAVSGSILGAGATGNVNTFINMSNAANVANCRGSKYANYYALAQFTYGFQIDVAVRKATFRKLWNLLRNSGDGGSRIVTGVGPTASSTLNGGNLNSSFVDLNGEDAASGALETLRRNLTEPNRVFLDRQSNLGVNFVNGLSLEGCRFEDAFSENTITPHLFYESAECTTGSSFFSQHLIYNPAVPKNLAGATEPACGSDYDAAGVAKPPHVVRACQFQNYLYNPQPSIRMSLGFNRNPKCVPYFGVRAKTKPNIPFMPGGGIELYAESFAQAFGGSIGPWWGPQYNSTDPLSLTDKRAPVIDVAGVGGAISFNQATEAANYSKYPGDESGLMSDAQLGFYSYEIVKNIVNVSKSIKIQDWSPIILNKEFLSQNPEVRKYEVMAIAPDLYDATYYSIEPDFFRNHFSKMISPDVLGPTVPAVLGAGGGDLIRPDLGSDLAPPDKYADFSIKDQLATAEQIINNSTAFPGQNRIKLAGSLASQANVLTSWNLFKIGDYELDTAAGSDMWNQKFGRCIQDVGGTPVTNTYKTIPNTSGNCLSGGRTGFSVRLVSKKYMGTGLGPNISNWPPP